MDVLSIERIVPLAMHQIVVGNRRSTMRVFIVACLVAGIVAVGAAAVLDNVVQESSAVAFTESGVRI